jgi:hypothetical protein
MQKTGESYTAARAQLLIKKPASSSPSAPAAADYAKLVRAFNDARTCAKWLPGVALTIRTRTRERYMRITRPDQTSVQLGFSGKGVEKSQVQIQHQKLRDRAVATWKKQHWRSAWRCSETGSPRPLGRRAQEVTVQKRASAQGRWPIRVSWPGRGLIPTELLVIEPVRSSSRLGRGLGDAAAAGTAAASLTLLKRSDARTRH